MATPCSEYPHLEDVRDIRRSIRTQREAKKTRERNLAKLRMDGNEVHAGEFSYKVINDPDSVRDAIREQKRDYADKRERERQVPEKTLKEVEKQVSKQERTGYTMKQAIVPLMGPSVEREVHYNSEDRKVGETVFTTDALGNPKQEHYDSEETKIGETQRGRWRGQDCAVHRDPQDTIIGYSVDTTDAMGNSIQKHYTPDGKHVGTTQRTTDSWGNPKKVHDGFYFKSILKSREEMREEQRKERRAKRGRRDALSSKFQGEIGELEATRIAMHALGLRPVTLDKPVRRDRGIDGVFRNPSSGNLVVVEAKCTQDRSGYGLDSLEHTNHGRQGSLEWVAHNASLMQDRTTSLYSRSNANIGREIQERGAENVERILIHVHPQSLNVTVSRAVGENSWEPTKMLKPSFLEGTQLEDGSA